MSKTAILTIASLLLIPLFLTSTGSLQAQDRSTLTLDEYKATLQSVRLLLDPSDNPQAALENAQIKLQQIMTVTFASGVSIPVWSLLSDVRTPEVAISRIDTVIEQISLSVHDQGEERLARLQAVLDRQPKNPLAEWWQRFLRWLRDFFRQFARNNPPPPEALLRTGETAGWVIMALVVVMIALLLSFWLKAILGNIIADRRLRRKNSEDDLPTTAAEARQEAQQLAQAGNYREAVRRMYLAALLGLDESGLIHYDRTLTNREVLAQITPIHGTDDRGKTAVQTHLRPVVDTFDRVWYGIHEPDAQSYRSYVAEIDELEAMVKRDE